MVLFDYLLLAVLLVSMGVGVFRGFFRELLSLFGWIVAVWVAWEYSAVVEPYLGSALSDTAKVWASRVILFVVVLMVATVVNGILNMVLAKAGLSGADRGLGMVFGFARGVLLVGLITIGAQVLQMPSEPWWEESQFVPYGTQVANVMREYLDAGVDYLQHAPENVLGNDGQ